MAQRRGWELLSVAGATHLRRWQTRCQLPVRCRPASGGPATRCLRRRRRYVPFPSKFLSDSSPTQASNSSHDVHICKGWVQCCSDEHPTLNFCLQVAMNLDASRTAAQQPVSSYPDICFAADNFEDGIDEMVCLRCESSEFVAQLLAPPSRCRRNEGIPHF